MSTIRHNLLQAIMGFVLRAALQSLLLCLASAECDLGWQVRVAIIREEGSNGDREMSSAVYSAGMEPWDITMSDLLHGRATLDTFQGEPAP